jgi:hypothetical protein
MMELDLRDAMVREAPADRLKLLTEQKKIWIDYYGTRHFVNLMPIRYVRNLRRWLARRALINHERYIWRYYIKVGHPYGDAANDAFEEAANLAMDEKPRVWLRQQPLYRQLLIREWRARGK